jgi:hypothetical protein
VQAHSIFVQSICPTLFSILSIRHRSQSFDALGFKVPDANPGLCHRFDHLDLQGRKQAAIDLEINAMGWGAYQVRLLIAA